MTWHACAFPYGSSDTGGCFIMHARGCQEGLAAVLSTLDQTPCQAEATISTQYSCCGRGLVEEAHVVLTRGQHICVPEMAGLGRHTMLCVMCCWHSKAK